jgi:hypothetical protein
MSRDRSRSTHRGYLDEHLQELQPTAGVSRAARIFEARIAFSNIAKLAMPVDAIHPNAEMKAVAQPNPT